MWKIVTVKTLLIDHRKRDSFREPILQCNDFKLKYLETFGHLLKHCFQVDYLVFPGKHALLSTSRSFLALCAVPGQLFSNLGFYVLLKKFQSDALESRFGWYSRMFGGSYFIAVQHVLQNEQKIKKISLIKFLVFFVQ